MKAHAEPLRERRTVPRVSVEQLEDPGRFACAADSLLDAFTVERVDQPDATLHDERMRAAFHELVDDPAEAGVELVAEADAHAGESTGTP